MVEYGVRLPFRIAAWTSGLACLAFAAASLASGGVLIVIGLLLLAPALLFLAIGWRGRVPAFVEEYGLDGPGEVENCRGEARRLGRLYE